MVAATNITARSSPFSVNHFAISCTHCWFLRLSICGSIARDMKLFTSVNQPEIIDILARGGVGIVRTDTLYGIIADANNESAVRRVYELKGRDDDKSPI